MISDSQGCVVNELGYDITKRLGERIAESIIQEKKRPILKITAK
jgi:hypothetical protein